MLKEAKRWLRQADRDLEAAKHSLQVGDFEWSCFQSQQSGEKALKAYLYSKGYTSIITHSLKELARECANLEKDFSELSRDARHLDMFYIPTRYPNGLAGELAPADFYEKEDAVLCLSCAESILSKVKKFLKI
jgi:HEPN domain-containing protein